MRLQAGYAAVLLLAFWQLCISAVAASDNRTTTERRVFLIGELSQPHTWQAAAAWNHPSCDKSHHSFSYEFSSVCSGNSTSTSLRYCLSAAMNVRMFAGAKPRAHMPGDLHFLSMYSQLQATVDRAPYRLQLWITAPCRHTRAAIAADCGAVALWWAAVALRWRGRGGCCSCYRHRKAGWSPEKARLAFAFRMPVRI